MTAFLAQHHALVTEVLAGIDHTPRELHALYLALAHASTLLMPLPCTPGSPPGSGSGSGSGSNSGGGGSAAATVVVGDTPAVTAARAAHSRHSASVAACQRAAKAAILDARIEAARNARWNVDVSACSVKAAVAKVRVSPSGAVTIWYVAHGRARHMPGRLRRHRCSVLSMLCVGVQAFREAYLWPELKQMLNAWGPIVDSVVDSEALLPEASIGACAAASSTFDASPLGIRFRVPSAGFMLIWATAPTSPAHLIGRRNEFGALFGSGGGGAPEGARSSGGVRAVQSHGVLATGGGGGGGGGGGVRTIRRVVQSCTAVSQLAAGGSGKGGRRRRKDASPTVHTIIRAGSAAHT